MDLIINSQGSIVGLYSEAIDLSLLGELRIERASHVEPTAIGEWTADMSPQAGPILGPFKQRSEALQAEQAWLLEHRLLKDFSVRA